MICECNGSGIIDSFVFDWACTQTIGTNNDADHHGGDGDDDGDDENDDAAAAAADDDDDDDDDAFSAAAAAVVDFFDLMTLLCMIMVAISAIIPITYVLIGRLDISGYRISNAMVPFISSSLIL